MTVAIIDFQFGTRWGSINDTHRQQMRIEIVGDIDTIHKHTAVRTDAARLTALVVGRCIKRIILESVAVSRSGVQTIVSHYCRPRNSDWCSCRWWHYQASSDR